MTNNPGGICSRCKRTNCKTHRKVYPMPAPDEEFEAGPGPSRNDPSQEEIAEAAARLRASRRGRFQ